MQGARNTCASHERLHQPARLLRGVPSSPHWGVLRKKPAWMPNAWAPLRRAAWVISTPHRGAYADSPFAPTTSAPTRWPRGGDSAATEHLAAGQHGPPRIARHAFGNVGPWGTPVVQGTSRRQTYSGPLRDSAKSEEYVTARHVHKFTEPFHPMRKGDAQASSPSYSWDVINCTRLGIVKAAARLALMTVYPLMSCLRS